MKRLLREILRRWRGQKVYRIDRLPICLELSDGDHAALYGWPDKYIDASDSCSALR